VLLGDDGDGTHDSKSIDIDGVTAVDSLLLDVYCGYIDLFCWMNAHM